MYRITYTHRGDAAEYPLYIPGDDLYCLTSGKAILQVGASGEVDLSIPDCNPAKTDVVSLTDEIILYRNEKEIWRGRAVTRQLDFYLTGTLTCEGIMSYLVDSYMPPYDYEGSVRGFVEMILDNHNSQVEEEKRFVLGNVTVTDNNDNIVRSSVYYDRTWSVLSDKCVNETLGGYFRVRIEDGIRYLDYLESYGTTASQAVEFGENLLDLTQNAEYADLATVILPLGARIEDDEGIPTDEYTTIASVNGGSIFYIDEEAVRQYGWIVVCAEWEDVTEPSNLLTKAKEYLAQVTSALVSFEINAVDLSVISDVDAIELGDHVLIKSAPHWIDEYVELTELDLDILSPENDVLTFGTGATGLTDVQRSADRATQNSLNDMAVRITNLVANTVTVEYLNANYVAANELEAMVASFGYVTADEIDAMLANFGYLTVDEADIRYASITDLDAALANITILNADLAAINYLLTGHESTETADIIHLTTDTAIIDEAVIANALVGTLLAQLIDAEYINTSQITIASEDGGITIVGNQMQIVDGQLIFYDENGTVRMQIGQDASGAFSFVLYDETGTGIMIDSEGIHESAVPDGLIVDSMVAEDAAIQGSKLDIASVAECLTEDGSLRIDYANVVIGDTNLSAWYATINESVDGLWDETSVLQTSLDVVQGEIEAKVWQSDIDDAVLIINGELETLNDKIEGLSTEGLISVTPYFCLWTSDTEAPPDDESLYSAICGTAVCGLAICGLSDGDTLWKDYDMPVTEGLYKWVKWLGTYLDGHTEWSVPYCVSDGWTVAEVTTLTEQYADLSVNVDSITAGVSGLYYVVYGSDEDNYAGLMAQAAELQLTSESITSQVENVTMTLYGDGEEDLGLESRMTSLIEQTSSDLSIVFSNAISETVDTIEGVQEQVNTINTYFDFSTDGLKISSSDSDFYLLIANNRIGFWQSEDEVAYISNSMLNIYDAYVSDSLQIGTFRWLPRESGNLSFIKATESSLAPDTPDEGGDDN